MVDLPRLEKANEFDKSLWNAEVLWFVTVLPLALSLIVGIVTYFIGVDADPRYFEVAAQIIPVLVLALLIEQRYFFQGLPLSFPSGRKRLVEKRERLIAKAYNYQVKMFLVFVGGEVAALWAVASANPSQLTFAATTAGLAAGAFALMASSGKDLLTSLGERKITQRNKSVEKEFVDEEKSRLEAWKLALKRAEEVPESKRLEFEQLMEYSALLVWEMDEVFRTNNLEKELQRLAQRKEQTGDLTSGQEMALRAMSRVKLSSDQL